ncbi:hypothetical protein BV22DRAFT_933570 [Leucogyrophana mollusca]|uniref:Uncharacterized protein n=1 Tax=Leucogyrophana mollusca TaxID=85980 RepID=A0ACB8AWE7_9AGAM|nr:hypothetical protein BV22DRAFT_933570 [Leucogyrophana mollusca]
MGGNGDGWGACGLSSCTCASNPVCGKGDSLGIKYGHCYIISFSDGQQLGSVRESTQYQKGGFFTDIPFKVCASTSNCAPGGYVQRGQIFNLQDQHGRYDDPNATKGWIDDMLNGGHMGFTTDASHAGKFSGIPTCADGECAIKVHGEPSGGGLGFACPATQPGITIWANPKMTQKLRFSEVTCDDYEVPPTSNIDPVNAAHHSY